MSIYNKSIQNSRFNKKLEADDLGMGGSLTPTTPLKELLNTTTKTLAASASIELTLVMDQVIRYLFTL